MSKDRYEDLATFYEFMLGPLHSRDEFKRMLQDTVTWEEVNLFFHLPFSGSITQAKLERKCKLPPAQMHAMLSHMASEGVVMIYTDGGKTVYERSNPVYMTEQQVRKAEDTPRRNFYARFFNTILTGEANIAAPTRTPYYRVVPVEATVTAHHGGRLIPINAPVPDPRGVRAIASKLATRGFDSPENG